MSRQRLLSLEDSRRHELVIPLAGRAACAAAAAFDSQPTAASAAWVSCVAALLACLLLLLLPRLLSVFVRRRTRSLPYPANKQQHSSNDSKVVSIMPPTPATHILLMQMQVNCLAGLLLNVLLLLRPPISSPFHIAAVLLLHEHT